MLCFVFDFGNVDVIGRGCYLIEVWSFYEFRV